MIAERVAQHLTNNRIPFVRRTHPRAIAAQELAASLHVSGYRVAKAVLVEADGRTWVAVLAAPEVIDRGRLAEALGARQVRLLREAEFAALFPDCELGAEPPLGGLYGLPVIVDRSLARNERIVFRAGSHDETIELDYADFARLEAPAMGDFGRMGELFGEAPLEART